MVKHSSKKQGGVGKNLVRRSIRVTNTDAENSSTNLPTTTVWSKVLQQATSTAKKQWTILLRTCSAVNLIPVIIDPVTGRAELATLWKRCIHYVLVTFFSVMMIYRTYVTFERVAQGHFDIFTYMSGAHFILHFVAACSFLGCRCYECHWNGWLNVWLVGNTNCCSTRIDENWRVDFARCHSKNPVGRDLLSIRTAHGVPTSDLYWGMLHFNNDWFGDFQSVCRSSEENTIEKHGGLEKKLRSLSCHASVQCRPYGLVKTRD